MQSMRTIMKTQATTRPTGAVASLAVFLSLSSVPPATAALIHLWDFNAGSELADSAGSLTLNVAPGEGDVGGVSGTVADATYEPGFNGFGQAFRPYYVDPSQSSTAGTGLTGSGFTSPSQFTIETIVKVDAKTSGSAVNYLFQTRPGSDRGYYLIQDEDNVGGGAIGGVGTIIGNNFGDVGIGAEYDSGDTWLYVAAVIDHSPVGMTSADVYMANLSNGETSPTLVLDDRTWNTADAIEGQTGIFGIGGFAIDRGGDGIAEASQEWFQGAIDYVAIYDTLLGPAELDQNLAARLVPEPSSVALLGLGGFALLRRKRRA
jgi:hypothetical protein